MQQKYIKFLIIILAVAVIAPQIAFASWWNPFSWGWVNRIFHFQQTEQKQEKQVVCTMDAKLCPDGSSVGREGPKCEFKACPESNCVPEGRVFGANDKNLQCCSGLTFQPTTQSGTAGKCVKVTDATANWKTYINNAGGYEIKYPKTCSFSEDNYTHFKIISCGKGKWTETEIYFGNSAIACVQSPSLQYTKKNINGTTFDYVNYQDAAMGGQRSSLSSYGATLNGKCFMLSSYVRYSDLSFLEGVANKKYTDAEKKEQATEIKEKEKFVDSIVSTLKFTTPNSMTANWATYTNAGYGSFKYPKSWGEPKEVSLATRYTIAFPDGTIGQYDNGFYVQIGRFSAREGTPNYQNGDQTSMTVQEIANAIKSKPYVKTFTQQNIELDGKQGIRIDYTYVAGFQKLTEIYVPIDAKGNILNISSDTSIIGEDLFKQILSTFSLI